MKQSRAIVLHKINYSETSIILKIYTEEEGLLSFIVKGIRGKKGKLRLAQFQALNLLEIHYKQTGKSTLRFITDLKISEPFSDLLFDPIKRAIALFLAELIQNCIQEEEQNEELFLFLHQSIHWLDLSKDSCTHFHLSFMVKLTKYLGFAPMENDKNAICFDLQTGEFLTYIPLHKHKIEGEELKAWKMLLDCTYENLNTLHFPNKLKRSLVQALMNYYKLHLIHFKELNSQHILQQIFDDE
jgi:DNA repair protein RecO (recombination protein O)